MRSDVFRKKDIVASPAGVELLQRKFSEDRQRLINIIFRDIPEPPFIICIPLDYRKHIMPAARINYDRNEFHIQYGEYSVCVQPSRHTPMFQEVSRLYSEGCTRQQIWNSAFRHFRTGLSEYHPSSLLLLLLELAREGECHAGDDTD
ncbi:hypothetical protein SD71_04535 [Cohnella kolymensis]|uniref:Uncharacterized protein n=1 Tax=Cohnella kolymensis TaxID=1590652 RepID=A0ABR5A7D9_9BACL|nr:hypothetical protein SD71_04535 [Cohnella kolymensis]